MDNNINSDFEFLDFLVIISFAIQMDDHNNSRSEYKLIEKRFDKMESEIQELKNILKGG